jgi:curved DNA-binding protein CbpA
MSHYETLGVGPDATQDEIKQAYRLKARDTHPDREGGDGGAMVLINQAYAVLGDPDRRQSYDAGGSGNKAADLDEKIAKGLVVVIGQALEKSGNMVANATKILNHERGAAAGRIAENNMLISRAAKRRALISAEEAPSGNVAHLLLDQKIQGLNRDIAQLEAHLEVLTGIEAELAHYSDAQPDPVHSEFYSTHPKYF